MTGAAAPMLKDGQALDRLSEQAERWGRSYKHVDDETKLRSDFDAKFRRDAEQLAARCTPPARPFGPKDWLLAVLLWLIIGGGVLAASIFLMQPDMFWFSVFVAVAIAIFVIGIGYVYYDTTNEKRAAKRLHDKTEWLLGASLRAAESAVRERRAKRS